MYQIKLKIFHTWRKKNKKTIASINHILRKKKLILQSEALTLANHYSVLVSQPVTNVSVKKNLLVAAQMTGLAFKYITVSLKLSKTIFPQGDE